MSNRGRRLGSDDPAQMSLLELLLQSQELRDEPTTEGSLAVGTRLERALSEAIRKSGLSRWEVAGRMSHLLGQEVTKFMLDAWTAESKDGHRFPASFLPAFCAATGCHEPLRLLAEAAGVFCLPGPEALRAEIQRLDEESKRLHREKQKRLTFLREMEGQ